MQSVFTGPVYVVRDNIDTDQIIPAQYLDLVPTIPEKYQKLGSYALSGLPESLSSTRYIKENQLDSDYPIVVGGRNFGCGSSRDTPPSPSVRRDAKSSWRKALPVYFSATASLLAKCIPVNVWTGFVRS